MKNKLYCLVFLPFFVIMLFFSSASAQVILDFETGLVSTGSNNVRVPGDIGTQFSLKNDLNSQSDMYYRFKVGYTFNKRNTISVLYAPLTVKSDGSFNRVISFNGMQFAAGVPIDASYTFNSYRITYRYNLINKEKLELGLGFTAKIRDAEIELKSASSSSSKTNVGFVPIINFRLRYLMNDRLGFLLEGDALAAKQGRAEDVLAALTYKLWDHIVIKGGYRILEGGADNDEVYNFSLFNYGAVGIIVQL